MDGLTACGATGSTLAHESAVSPLADQGEQLDRNCHWYAVWTRSRQEKVAATFLDAFGVYYYLPINSEFRKWSDRRQRVEVPLFRGYLFVRINPFSGERLQVLKTPGVVGLVGNQAGPLPIPDREIEDLRTVLAAQVKCSEHPFLKEGDRVQVVRGVLAGIEGILLLTNSEERILISIGLIHQSLAVNVLRKDIELIRASTPRN